MIINATIAELDIRKASVNVWYQHGAIDEETYNKLCSMDRQERQVTTGLMRKDNPELTAILKENIPKYIEKLKESNNIDDSSVLKVVNDALWLINVIPVNLQFGYVEFVVKGVYELYYKYKNFEFFLENMTNRLVTKGVPHSIADNGSPMLDLIREVMINYIYEDKNQNYDLLHKAKQELTKDPNSYGPSLLNSETGNLFIVKHMIINFV